MVASSRRFTLVNVKKVSCLGQTEREANVAKCLLSSLRCRSLPEPLMTYELHGEFILPASTYVTETHTETFSLRFCRGLTAVLQMQFQEEFSA